MTEDTEEELDNPRALDSDDSLIADLKYGGIKAGICADELGYRGVERAVEPLILLAQSEFEDGGCEFEGADDWEVFEFAVDALGIIGDKRAVEPLISLLNKDLNPESFPYGVARKAVANALGTIVETEVGEKEKNNIIKFLTSNDPALVKMGITMLKGILENK